MSAEELWRDYQQVRNLSGALCEPLEIEDHVVQSMPDASPVRWHLAHTTWFFECFVVGPHAADYEPACPGYRTLFNSYYQGVGPQFSRAQRGLLTRPTVRQVLAYRRAVDQAMEGLLASADEPLLRVLRPLVTLGLNHEQQHQELLLTDLKHAFSLNPLDPVYLPPEPNEHLGEQKVDTASPMLACEGGMTSIGYRGEGFHFDNEGPAHPAYLAPYKVAPGLVTNADYQDFIRDGGYQQHALWLSDGWEMVQTEAWNAPLYWRSEGEGDHSLFTLRGRKDPDPQAPVCHLSYFEADAFATWAGARLPTEQEWENAARTAGANAPRGTLLGDRAFHPVGRSGTTDPQHFVGEVWEWTASAYTPYPGFRPLPGTLGEYNGKFMSGQMVLRGGSCASQQSHLRLSYRNFFGPAKRWQFAGLRLAKDA